MRHSYVIFLIVFLSFIDVTAQELQGRVTAFGDIPLYKVEVQAKSGAKVLTNDQGEFRINIKEKDLLSFKASGFINKKVRTAGYEFLKVNLLIQEGNTAGSKAVANSHLSAEDLEQGVATAGTTNFKYYEFSDIYEVLRLEKPGIKFDESGNTKAIYLLNQGVHTLTSDMAALLIVDGSVVSDISMIQPSEIKDLRIHQGVEASFWGVRGANGVIEITLLKSSSQ